MNSREKLVFGIMKAVREAAQEIPKFRDEKNGACRILIYPCCKDADDWLGGLSKITDEVEDIMDYEWTAAITEGGSRVVKIVEDGKEYEIDCYAYSALKIAHCSRAQDEDAGLLSGLELKADYLVEENGYGPYRGALCVEVTDRRVENTPADGERKIVRRPFCGVYICVSGAESDEDLKCAMAGVPAIKDFFTAWSYSFSFKEPEIIE